MSQSRLALVGRWCGLLIVAAGLCEGRAAAQTEPVDPLRPTLRIGPFDLRPRLTLTGIGVDNNVFNEPENPKTDFTFTTTPDLEIGVNPRRLKMTFRTGAEFVYFRTYTSERSTNRNFGASAELDLSRIRPFVSYSSAHTSARAGNEVDVRARHHPRAVAGGSRFLLASRTSVMVSVRRSVEDYDEGEEFRGAELSTTLNSTTTAYEAALGLELTPLTSFSLAVVREQIRMDLSPERDADSIRLAPTLTFSPIGLLGGTASLGYRRFEGRDVGMPGYSGLTAAGTLRLLIGSRHQLETTFTRDVQYSYDPASPYYVQAGGRATFTTQVVGPFDLRVTGGRVSMDYRAFAGAPPPGRDTFTTYGGGLGYRITERLQFVLSAEYNDRASERSETRGYSNNRIFGALNWGALNR